MFSNHSRAFARGWDRRSGIDSGLLDGDALRRMWTAPRPHSGSAMALQAAWLAVEARELAAPPGPGAPMENPVAAGTVSPL
jgi:hypothetical protein